MNRMDERKQIERPKIEDAAADEDELDTGEGSGIPGVASTPRAARRDEEPIARERVSRERGDPQHNPEDGENAAMVRSPGKSTRRAEEGYMRKAHEEELGERGTVKGGREIMKEKVEAEHVIGKAAERGSAEAYSAEGQVDGESSKAERKEAMEPERAANEHEAMRGAGRSTPTKHTMGWGERETVAKHTI